MSNESHPLLHPIALAMAAVDRTWANEIRWDETGEGIEQYESTARWLIARPNSTIRDSHIVASADWIERGYTLGEAHDTVRGTTPALRDFADLSYKDWAGYALWHNVVRSLTGTGALATPNRTFKVDVGDYRWFETLERFSEVTYEGVRAFEIAIGEADTGPWDELHVDDSDAIEAIVASTLNGRRASETDSMQVRLALAIVEALAFTLIPQPTYGDAFLIEHASGSVTSMWIENGEMVIHADPDPNDTKSQCVMSFFNPSEAHRLMIAMRGCLR